MLYSTTAEALYFGDSGSAVPSRTVGVEPGGVKKASMRASV
jgi:hypothetical protein